MSHRTRPRIMGMPRRYVQGPGTLDLLGETVAAISDSVAIIADELVWSALGERILSVLAASGLVARRLPFAGECTEAEISRLVAMADGAGCVLAAGGGKAIDTAKGVATALSREVVVFPTIASNDSPTSRLIVVYSEDHVLERARRMEMNPAVVVVDTEVILAAPRRFLLAGIGDALSKIHEVSQSTASGGANFFDGSPPLTALAISRCCWEVIRNDASAALAAHSAGTANEAFERLVEATILMSGLAFENGGLSVAHAVLRGFSAQPAFSRSLHGEQVAVGLVIQLLTDPGNIKTARDVVDFCRKIGLPVTLAELGADRPAEEIARSIAEFTFRTAPYVTNIDIALDVDGLEQAILAADRLGRSTTRPTEVA